MVFLLFIIFLLICLAFSWVFLVIFHVLRGTRPLRCLLNPTDTIVYTTAFVTPVVEHWIEREIAATTHRTMSWKVLRDQLVFEVLQTLGRSRTY